MFETKICWLPPMSYRILGMQNRVSLWEWNLKLNMYHGNQKRGRMSFLIQLIPPMITHVITAWNKSHFTQFKMITGQFHNINQIKSGWCEPLVCSRLKATHSLSVD